jgi:hypothetical protein
MARDLDSVTMSDNMEGVADTLTNVAGTQIKLAEITATVMEVLPTPAGASTQIVPKAVPPTINGDEVQWATPSDTTEAAGTPRIARKRLWRCYLGQQARLHR